MSSDLFGERQPSFRYTLSSAKGSPLGRLDGVSGGNLELNIANTIRCSGDVSAIWTREVNDCWLQIEYLLDEGLATERAWPVAKLRLATPTRTHAGTKDTQLKVEGYDRLIAPNQAKLRRTLHLPKGTVVTDAVLDQLSACGVTDAAITRSTRTLSAAMTWKVDTTRLQVINDLLDAIGFWSLQASETGQLYAGPYRKPAKRGIAYRFVEGEVAIHKADFDEEQDLFNVPNVVIGVARTNGDEEPITYSRVNSDPNDPLSTVSRGLEIVKTISDIEVSAAGTGDDFDTKQALDIVKDKVDDAFDSIGWVPRTLIIQHAWMPLKLNDVVYFDTDSVKGYFTITQMGIPLDPKLLVSTTLKEVKM